MVGCSNHGWNIHGWKNQNPWLAVRRDSLLVRVHFNCFVWFPAKINPRSHFTNPCICSFQSRLTKSQVRIISCLLEYTIFQTTISQNNVALLFNIWNLFLYCLTVANWINLMKEAKLNCLKWPKFCVLEFCRFYFFVFGDAFKKKTQLKSVNLPDWGWLSQFLGKSISRISFALKVQYFI